jgi:hypothetical protein
MTTSHSDMPILNLAPRCFECNEPLLIADERFCSDECYDLWKYGRGNDVIIYRGRSQSTPREAVRC